MLHRNEESICCDVSRRGMFAVCRLPSAGCRLAPAFAQFNLRHQAELRALKLFLFFVARRNNKTNLAAVSFETIRGGTGILEHHVRSGLNILVLNGLVHIERLQRQNEDGYFHAYRISHVDPFRHMGTSGQTDDVNQELFSNLIAQGTEGIA